jgi:gluconolactonase
MQLDCGPRWRQDPCRYPDSAIESVDARFEKYVVGNAGIERLFTGARWCEGPVWFGDGRYLLWSDIPNDRILRWTEETGTVSVFRQPSRYTNGNTRDREGRLVSCEHFSRSVTRTELDGRVTTLSDGYDGKRLNGPNDVVVRSDGSIWFTDPGYGSLGHYEGEEGEMELSRNVYRIDPHSGETTLVADDFDRPNGLCFSPDEAHLYIADTGGSHTPDGPKHIRVCEVKGDRLGDSRVFVDMGLGLGDGLRMDRDGNVWVGAGWVGEGYDGVHCYAPDGDLIGRIHLPEGCANLCFGGYRKNRLFMAAGQSLYSLYLNTVGLQWP